MRRTHGELNSPLRFESEIWNFEFAGLAPSARHLPLNLKFVILNHPLRVRSLSGGRSFSCVIVAGGEKTGFSR